MMGAPDSGNCDVLRTCHVGKFRKGKVQSWIGKAVCRVDGENARPWSLRARAGMTVDLSDLRLCCIEGQANQSVPLEPVYLRCDQRPGNAFRMGPFGTAACQGGDGQI